jgi:hypothetical protein
MTRSVLRAGSALAFCLSSHLAVLSAAESGGPPAPAAQGPVPNGILVHETKPYVLFMGANISVEKDKAFDPIEEVTSSVITVDADGKPANVFMQRGVNLQVRDDLKLSEKSVTVTDLKSERAYSPRADPFKSFAHAENIAAGADAAADLAQSVATRMASVQNGAPMPGVTPVPGENTPEAIAAASAAESARQEADHENSMLTPLAGNEAAGEGQGMFDAIRVSFAVTPKVDLAKPYIAVVAQIRDPGGKNPGQRQPWIYLQPMGAMAAGATTKVTVYQEGMPAGYTLEKCDIHLYDGREELATSVSNKRVLLTEDEALTFRVIEYVAANRGRTLPAVPAKFVRDRRSSLTQAELDQACYVRVAKDGKVAATFSDKGATVPLQDEALDAALRGLRFKPAIEAGKPVESIVAVRLGMIASPNG